MRLDTKKQTVLNPSQSSKQSAPPCWDFTHTPDTQEPDFHDLLTFPQFPLEEKNK